MNPVVLILISGFILLICLGCFFLGYYFSYHSYKKLVESQEYNIVDEENLDRIQKIMEIKNLSQKDKEAIIEDLSKLDFEAFSR